MNKPSPRVAALLEKMHANRGRLLVAIDATASREPTWDMAMQLQSTMFETAAKLGGLDVQLCWYRGVDEVGHTPWFSDVHELVSRMSMIKCAAGTTKIGSVLQHVRAEHAREKIGAVIFVGDAVEESPHELYAATAGQPPWFLFQEGAAPVVMLDRYGAPVASFDTPVQQVEFVFREIARLTGGAYARFDSGAAARLEELLRAVAAFAVGGTKALANMQGEEARKLLGQVKS